MKEKREIDYEARINYLEQDNVYYRGRYDRCDAANDKLSERCEQEHYDKGYSWFMTFFVVMIALAIRSYLACKGY